MEGVNPSLAVVERLTNRTANRNESLVATDFKRAGGNKTGGTLISDSKNQEHEPYHDRLVSFSPRSGSVGVELLVYHNVKSQSGRAIGGVNGYKNKDREESQTSWRRGNRSKHSDLLRVSTL